MSPFEKELPVSVEEQFNESYIEFFKLFLQHQEVISDDLSTGSVNCFHKDSKGFLWIGTSSGLNRFNGYNIKILNPDPSDTLVFQSKD